MSAPTLQPLGELEADVLEDVPRDDAGRVHLDAVADALSPCDVLESPPGTGWSYVVPHDGARLQDDGVTTVLLHPDGSREAMGSDPFLAVDAVCERLGVEPAGARDASLPPFTGGLVGGLGYDLARRIEHLPDPPLQDRPARDLSLRIATALVAVSADRADALLLRRGDPATASRVRDQLRRAARSSPAVRPHAPAPRPPGAVVATTSLPRSRYLDAVEAVLAAIAAGDVFQVNLTQRLNAPWGGDLLGLYRALRHQSAAIHGAVLPDIGVASISPETFLRTDGAQVVTRPIKGTRPRAADAELDAAFADDLATSDKDRAENVMVVDLERNDLGRVCVPGSVRVPELLRVEAHPTVWHLVSTVVGLLRPQVGYGELLRATFPCGSITGAPKVAAMQLIDRLEPVRRGWYCGAIGYLAPGAANLSVAIRTATLHGDGTADHGAGGGVVADSDPAAEHAESLDKAAAFLRATRAHLPAATAVSP